MTKANDEDTSAFFWKVAESYLTKQNITKSTMMGFPCLRVNGDFFASCDREKGNLIVKLPKDRVQELIGSGVGQDFAPNGRKFKEWMAVELREEKLWNSLIDEALVFVAK